jgi:hypothetical protein
MAQNHAMDADLQPVADALADFDDDHLHALIETDNDVSQITPGLLAWIEHAADWEVNRRRGLDFPLQPPDAAIPLEEDAISLDAALMLRQRFAQDERAEARGVGALLDTVVRLLSASGRRH